MGSGASGRGERGEELLALAGAALGRGDWAGARDAYRQVLEGGESAAVLEGLAYACWWLQEDATTVDCRRRAFRLYLDADDKVSAARVAISPGPGPHTLGRALGRQRVGGAGAAAARRGRAGGRGRLARHRQDPHRVVRRPRPPAGAPARRGGGRAVGSRDVEMQALA
jgi:hypothetical protein